MINPQAKLNSKLFDGFDGLIAGKDVEQVPVSKGFGEGLLFAYIL